MGVRFFTTLAYGKYSIILLLNFKLYIMNKFNITAITLEVQEELALFEAYYNQLAAEHFEAQNELFEEGK